MSQMFWCKLVDKKGFVSECFYREATSYKDVMNSLNSFHSSEQKGKKWVIESQYDDEEYD